jgi:hypothetical protein
MTCQARSHKRGISPCGKKSDTVRRVQAAPGLWIHVKLCHFHQHHWDEGLQWGGPLVVQEAPCQTTELKKEVARLKSKYEERCWCSVNIPATCGHKRSL